jgi:hypothetical protein
VLGFADRFRGFVVVPWWLLIFADRIHGFVVVVVGFFRLIWWVCGGGCWVLPIDFLGLWWWWLLGLRWYMK